MGATIAITCARIREVLIELRYDRGHEAAFAWAERVDGDRLRIAALRYHREKRK